ncbi:hypothetical protein OIU91_36635 [Streptomyces sp. NBC_01456]|uniref:hypothetical protein n=1 Tax=unclassified Streptomyces TaxID=2593676 RepID=UPI002E33AB00|nr:MULTISPECIES: hypothetical protein [unclassified Streptomyces]
MFSLETFNYAPLALIAVLAPAWIWWRCAGERSYDVPVPGSGRSVERGGEREGV